MKVFVVGSNRSAQLGDPSLSFTDVPVQIEFPHKIVQVVCGESHSLFLAQNGLVYSAGWNKYGQCGFFSPSNSLFVEYPIVIQEQLLPSDDFSKRKIVKISSSTFQSAFVTHNMELFTCGINVAKLYPGERINFNPVLVPLPTIGALEPPIFISQTHKSLTVASKSTLFYKTAMEELFQQDWKIPFEIEKIESGANHTVILTTNGQLFGLGSNNCNQLSFLGNDSIYFRHLQNMSRQIKILDVGCGKNSTMFITAQRSMYICGGTIVGECGTTSISAPCTALAVIDPWAQGRMIKWEKLYCATFFTYAISESHQVFCSGANGYGELGLKPCKNIKQFVYSDAITQLLVHRDTGYKVVEVAGGVAHAIFLMRLDLDNIKQVMYEQAREKKGTDVEVFTTKMEH